MKRVIIFGIFILLIVVGFIGLSSIKTIKDTQTTSSSEDASGDGAASLGMPAEGNKDVPEMVVGDHEGEDYSGGYGEGGEFGREFEGTCPEPLNLETPIDLSLATSVLYPGQIRGGDYKPHGGFRFDNVNDNKISVKIPMNSILSQGGRYIEGGNIQYMFDFIAPCGIQFRFDHLLVLSPKLQEIADKLPEPLVDDSRTYKVDPIDFVSGEEIALEVGHPNNVFVDFGVYDLREKNEASQSSEFIQNYPSDLASHAVCWLDLLSGEDSAIVKSLPGSGQEGKTSEYC